MRPLPRAIRHILRAAALLAPAHRRSAWRRQWEAEIRHRWATHGASGLARFSMGSVAHAWQLRRDGGTGAGWLADLRFSGRALARRPGFVVITVTTLGVGIGAAVAVFSLAEAFLLRPLPHTDSDRLVRIFSTNAELGHGRFSLSYPDFADFTSRTDLFESASFYIDRDQDVAGELAPERVRATAVYTDFFETLRSPVLLGRALTRQDHEEGSEPTAVLSEGFWAARFGRDSTIVGRTVRLDGTPVTVVGVIPDPYGWPRRTQVWTPLAWGGAVPAWADTRTNHTWQTVGRLTAGVDADYAAAQVASMAEVVYSGPEIPEREAGTRAVVVPLHSSEGGEDAGALFGTLGAAVFFVLLIACMNASGMLLTRARARTRELSLRAAIGAGRARLAFSLMAESILLALLGGALGLVLGYLGLEWAFSAAPPFVRELGDPALNGTVIAGGLTISLIAALMAGLPPAIRASRMSVAGTLRDGSPQSGQGTGATRIRRFFVVGELALSLTLLAAAFMTVTGFQRQLAADPGFDPAPLLSFTVTLPESRYGEAPLVEAYFRDAVTALEAHPAISAATSTSRLPLGAGGISLGRSFIFEGADPPPSGVAYPASWVEIDPGWFTTMGLVPVEGRAFEEGDGAGSEPVAIVNATMASRMSPDGSIVGRVIRSHYDENVARRVVGVLADVQMNGVSRERRQPMVFVPRAQAARTAMAFLVRTSGDPSELAGDIRDILARIDTDVAVDGLQTLRDAHRADLAGIRFLTTLFASFGTLALVLAVGGVYGLVSYSVAQRTQEFGVRMAMGATSTTVRRSVLRESALLASIGLPIGLGLAWAAGRVLASGMDGIAIPQAWSYAVVALILAAAVLLATWIPAVRATRVDPVHALRID